MRLLGLLLLGHVLDDDKVTFLVVRTILRLGDVV